MSEHTIRVPNVDGDATAVVSALQASESPAAARVDARIDTRTDTVLIEAGDTAAVEWAFDWLESTRHHARRRGADADAQAAATIANAVCDVLDERAIADGGVDELLQTIKNDRSKALRAPKTVGDVEQVDDPRTAVRYLEDRGGVPYFEVVTTVTTGFPLGRDNVSEQTQEPVTSWCEANDPVVIDVRGDDGFVFEVGDVPMTDAGTEVEQRNPDCDLPMCVGSPNSDTKTARDDEGHGDLIEVCEDCLNSGIAGFVEVVGEDVVTDGGVPAHTADASAWTPGAPRCQCGVDLTAFTSRVQARRIARVYGDADGVVPGCPACVETRTGAPGITRVTVAIKKETQQITEVGR